MSITPPFGPSSSGSHERSMPIRGPLGPDTGIRKVDPVVPTPRRAHRPDVRVSAITPDGQEGSRNLQANLPQVGGNEPVSEPTPIDSPREPKVDRGAVVPVAAEAETPQSRFETAVKEKLASGQVVELHYGGEFGPPIHLDKNRTKVVGVAVTNEENTFQAWLGMFREPDPDVPFRGRQVNVHWLDHEKAQAGTADVNLDFPRESRVGAIPLAALDREEVDQWRETGLTGSLYRPLQPMSDAEVSELAQQIADAKPDGRATLQVVNHYRREHQAELVRRPTPPAPDAQPESSAVAATAAPQPALEAPPATVNDATPSLVETLTSTELPQRETMDSFYAKIVPLLHDYISPDGKAVQVTDEALSPDSLQEHFAMETVRSIAEDRDIHHDTTTQAGEGQITIYKSHGEVNVLVPSAGHAQIDTTYNHNKAGDELLRITELGDRVIPREGQPGEYVYNRVVMSFPGEMPMYSVAASFMTNKESQGMIGATFIVGDKGDISVKVTTDRMAVINLLEQEIGADHAPFIRTTMGGGTAIKPRKATGTATIKEHPTLKEPYL